ncbi:MAG: hypothetical protein CMF51_02275 [Legionellales bacterium]|nr:hypothetical protein [Legionellales bacterium]
MSSACAPESGGRITAGVVLGLLSGVFSVLFFLEYSYRPVLDIDVSLYEDTSLLLFWADAAALSSGLVSAILLLLPELCCETRRKDDPSSREDFRRERNTAALVLVIAVVVFSATARIRDVNFSTEPNDHQVCGSQTSARSCPTQRALLNPDYVEYLKASETCWFNTSAPTANAFNWGESLKDASAYPTSDFSKKETYELHPEFAKCFFWGCGGELCNPEMYNHQDVMLKLEVAVAVIFTGLVIVAMCVGLPETQYAYVSVREMTPVGVRTVRTV